MNFHVDTNSEIDPQNVYVLIVGIEKYLFINNLNGPARDALKFLKWILQRKVPNQNIKIFLSPLDKNVDEVGVELNALHHDLDYKCANRSDILDEIDRLRKQAGPNKLLHVFWSGHGFITRFTRTTRRLFYADTTPEGRYNLDLDSFLEALRTSCDGTFFSRQCIFVDACASPISIDSASVFKAEGSADDFILPSFREGTDQFILFAAAEDQTAINDSEIGIGRFSQAVFEAIKDSTLFPDMVEVARRVKASASESQSYKPIFWKFETGGEDRDISAGRSNSGARHSCTSNQRSQPSR